MFNWFQKWVGSPPAPTASAASPASAALPDVTAPVSTISEQKGPTTTDWGPGTISNHEFNVQTAAMRWVFSLGTVGGPTLSLGGLVDAVERMSLDATRAADWVPRVPSVLPGLLKSLRDEHSSAQDLAQLIEQDVVLVAEALKEANSALHQRTTTVTQTAEAVRLLGSHGLRMLIARVAFRPVLGDDSGPLIRAGAPKVWSLGEACAECSQALAPARGVDAFEAFLSGLALQVGHLVALRMADRVAHLARPDPHGLGPRSLPVGEANTHASDNHAAQDMAHAMAILSHRVAARWELPDNVVGAITAQVDPLAFTHWPEASELLGVAQDAARLRVLDQAGKLPAPLADCCLYLPDDAQAWLLTPPKSKN